MSAKILIVEDEESMARFIELELLHEGYTVSKAGDGRAALALAASERFDLILLDIMLPGINGIEVLRRLGPENAPPVILLTARDAVMDKVAGLDAGAVDYITKPFAIEELLARIRVALKLHPVASYGAAGSGTPAAAEAAGGPSRIAAASREEGVYSWKALVLDERRHRVTWDGKEITLTNREFLMLKTLLLNQDIVLSRDTLLEKVCGYDYVGETNVVDVYIRFLRSKIDEVFGVRMIQTVRGVGYVIKSE
ncbi:MAG: response regulator transcription factor [Parasporobacterium sp.]|nr:response regulator transcription factor [Parasporobacterium sp.]